ncbi:MAG: TIGR00341 family protein [Bacteroidia bacterium]
MFRELRAVLVDVINLRDTTDVRGTIDSIRNSITIKGYNVWILACAAMLASIGLDTNSVAVIIGAMLISPLMSPILGIGLSVGINDREHLILALKNFSVAVGSSLLVSMVYFSITPLGSPTPEIMNRTYPTVLDVLVAIFGGVAGIVAGSRKDKTNAIPGVAIATALMPPLCVAGYGIAKWRWEIFAGALYLFFINAVFISLSTYVIVRFLRFPYVEYMDEKAHRRAVRWIAAFALIVIVPSLFFMYNVYRKVRLESSIQAFIDKEVNNRYHEAVKYEYELGDTLKTLSLAILGPPLTQDSIDGLVGKMPAYNLADFQLICMQGPAQLRRDELLDQGTLKALEAVQPSLDKLQTQIDSLARITRQAQVRQADWAAVQAEIGVLFPEVLSLTYTQQALVSGPRTDTLPLVIVRWDPRLRAATRATYETRLQAWLEVQLAADTVVLVAQ